MLCLLDIVLLYAGKQIMLARRILPKKLSNGDENEIRIYLKSEHRLRVNIKVIDELPFQFQVRDQDFRDHVDPQQEKIISYTLRPVTRGEYYFGALNVYTSTIMGLFSRRHKFSIDQMVPVYPSFLQLRKFELLAISNRLSELGVKKVRKIGHSMEFEQINEYVRGDDFRSINWKATARSNQLMVNQFQDERSQNIYCLIDKGRTMKMPFNGMTLQDYAINASLVLSSIAIRKHDKAGMFTFADKVDNYLPADNRSTQMFRIQELLYNQKTNFLEADYGKLYINIKRKVNQRSLIVLFTNFETRNAVNRQLKGFLQLAKHHVLVVVFFKNRELVDMSEENAEDLNAVYQKTIAEKFVFEKQQVIKELNNRGVYTVHTYPEDLTVNTINKYLEMKARNAI